MINIIGDSCVASNITLEILKQQYVNPFCWNIIDYISFGYLIKNYKNINFNNIQLKKHPVVPKYTLIIDEKINVFYEHYIEDNSAKTIKKENNNVYYYDIKSYIISKYKSRLKLNNKPIFTIGSSWNIEKDKNKEFEFVINQNVEKYPLFVIVNKNSDYLYLKKYENNYTKIFKTNLVKNNTALAFDIYNKYKIIFDKNDDGIKWSKINYSDKYKKVE